MLGTGLGFFLLILGILLIAGQKAGAHHATRLYGRLGFEVTEEAYARQFKTVGFILVVLGAGLVLDLI